MQIVPVILCGGSGTRLWPLSRQAAPKQLLKLYGKHSLLQETALRVNEAPFAAPVVICSGDHEFMITEQLQEIGVTPQAVIVEPVGRNTAPAVAIAALALGGKNDQVMLVMASDHIIRDVAAFRKAALIGAGAAGSGHLVTFGIDPTGPHTGYGYIQRGAQVKDHDGLHHVMRFVEKPGAEAALGYVMSGDYAWNSGIFLFTPARYLEELARYRPLIDSACRKTLAESLREDMRIPLDRAAFDSVPSDSIDYAVMEHTDRAAMVPVAMGWSDLGSWSALWQEKDKDENGNAVTGDVISVASENSLLHSEEKLLVSLGVKDMVVVVSKDAVLVAHKDHADQIKDVVGALRKSARSEADVHAISARPWGTFQGIAQGGQFQVKHILVKPGRRLSLQKHKHRGEHWVVVDGTALVTVGDKVFPLRENESTFIPAGEVHRLENPGTTMLHIIEVQYGSYLGEDDIERLADDFGRVQLIVNAA